MNKNKVIPIVIFAIVAWFFLQFIYLPKAGEVKRFGAEYRDIKRDIAGLYNFIGGEENLKDNLIKMRDYVKGLEKAFPSEKEASNTIKQLNKEAMSLKVNVISVKPGDLISYTDASGSQLKIFDYLCKSMPLNLSVEARYQALGEFLNKIEFDRNPMISVRKVEIRKDMNMLPKIRADIELNACVLGE
ncbi:MAG: type 4a pilus biogenesis protein PilO [Candidatus Omnitrophota bacterium]|nr:type 4a pilus biogenesis protein PilO [Candidatus Omnitrophota bacterium]